MAKNRAEELQEIVGPHLKPGEYMIVITEEGQIIKMSDDFLEAHANKRLTPAHTLKPVLMANALLQEMLQGHYAITDPAAMQAEIHALAEAAAAERRSQEGPRIHTPGRFRPRGGGD
jgi:hypothetical protein